MIRKVDKRGYLGRHFALLVKDIKQERLMTHHPRAVCERDPAGTVGSGTDQDWRDGGARCP